MAIEAIPKYTQMEFEFVKNLAKSSTKGAFWSKCKSIGNFLIGDWARPTGIEYHALKKTDKAISIFDAFHRYKTNTLVTEKAIKVAGQAEKIAKAAGTTATQTVSKGFFKSTGKFLSKFGMPILLWLEPIMNACSEMKNGGNIVSIAKEFVKGMFSMAGYAAGTLFATAVLGLATGGWAFVGTMIIGALGSMAFNYVAKAIFGESTGEKLARQKAEKENNALLADNGNPDFYAERRQKLPGTSFGCYNQYTRQVNVPEIMQQAENSFRVAQNIFMNRNNQGLI